jgi:hypothetical protein
MKTRNTLLTLATLAAASALPFTASAQAYNPDNDSVAFFRNQPSGSPVSGVTVALPEAGEQSRDGLYVYSGTDRGWVNRQHSFVVRGGQLTHTADCLPYNLPTPVAAYVPVLQKGVFADHGS